MCLFYVFVFYITFSCSIYPSNLQNVSNSTSSNDTSLSNEQAESKNSDPILVQSSDYYCSCDLKPHLCDINCCCDKMCTEDERKIFSHCLTSVSRSADARYCYSKNLLYTINAVHESTSLSSSLFCVAWDNVVKKDEYPARETITSLSELKRVTSSSNGKHTWFQSDDESVLFRVKTHKHHGTTSKLKSGDAVRVLGSPSGKTRDVFTPWKLPSSILANNGVCNSFQPVTYLNNFKSKCVQVVSDLRRECTSNVYFSPRLYHEDIVMSKNKPAEVVIGSLHLTRHYLHEKDDPETGRFENRYTMRSDQCESGGCVTITVNGSYDVPQYVYDGQRKIGACFNAVSSVSYDVSFNAKTGITEIIVTFQQSPIIQGQKYVQQTFTVNFNQEINSSLLVDHLDTFDRSGNPGYLFNKPIYGTAFDGSMNSTGYHKLSDPIQSKSDGTCKLSSPGNPQSSTQVSEVGFKVNSKSGCRIGLNTFIGSTSVCSDLQSQIVETWKLNDEMSHFAIFGNSNTSISSQWVPVVIDNSMAQIIDPRQVPVLTLDGNCPSIITSISYDIYFADIGLKSEPQSMLLSVVKKYSDPIEVKVQSSNTSSQKLGSVSSPWIEVSFSIAFHDLTIPSRPSFAPPPTVKLQLPPDFFYPFFVSSNGHKIVFHNYTLIILVSYISMLSKISLFHNQSFLK